MVSPEENQQEAAEEVLYKVKEVARRLRMDDTTVRKLVQAGQIAAIRLPGGHIRIPKSELDRILAPPQ